jgi:hypothetical protein
VFMLAVGDVEKMSRDDKLSVLKQLRAKLQSLADKLEAVQAAKLVSHTTAHQKRRVPVLESKYMPSSAVCGYDCKVIAHGVFGLHRCILCSL